MTSSDADVVLEDVLGQGSRLVTGPHGIGKSHLLREIAGSAEDAGLTPVLVHGSPAADAAPLAAFASVIRDKDGPLTATAIIDALARRRSRSLLLVDAVDQLDRASQVVVGQLLRTTRVRAVLTARGVAECPEEVQALYDAGFVSEIALGPVRDHDMSAAVAAWLGGPVTPATMRATLASAAGNPLIARELIAGTLASGSLRTTPHGWDIEGPVAATPRLSRLIGAHLEGLEPSELDAAAIVAMAGPLPEDCLDGAAVRTLLRSGIVTRDTDGWLRASQPLLVEAVRASVNPSHWHQLARDAIAAIDGNLDRWPDRASELERNAATVALGQDIPLSLVRALALAAHALGAGDPQLALRAATAALEAADRPDTAADARVTGTPEAYRVRGLAASTLGLMDEAAADLRTALETARADAQITAAALAAANHAGLAERNPRAAVEVIEQARSRVIERTAREHLDRAALRWGAVAGRSDQSATAPQDVTDEQAAQGLATMAMAAVVTGPLAQAEPLVARLRALPPEVIALAPGAAALTELAAIMAVSYSGDIRATRHELEERIAASVREAPEMAGVWEYALGVAELFAADAAQAARVAQSAVRHLEWRDPLGLLAPATALRAAASEACGLEREAAQAWEAIPAEAAQIPNVVLLRTWTEGRRCLGAHRRERACETLRDGAAALLAVQHPFLAGKLAHCAVRVSGGDGDALELLRQAHEMGGGGLLEILLEHGQALAADDARQLEALAIAMEEMGLVVSAADTWLTLGQQPGRFSGSELDARRWQVHASRLRSAHESLALWRDAGPADQDTLTPREYAVADLAAQRYTAKEIADAHGVSTHTVNNQLSAAYRKLGVSSRRELREVWETAGDHAYS